MLNLIHTSSDVSRTNQIRINNSSQEVAEKLFQYLFKKDKGIEHFRLNDVFPQEEGSAIDYQKRDKRIRGEIRNRLIEYGKNPNSTNIQYFIAYSNGENYVFFLSPNKEHSGWKHLFENGGANRERIFNLVFKFHILSQNLSIETIDGFEELLLIHEQNLSKTKDALFVWGQSIYINYNYFDVLTLTLTRKKRLFLLRDDFTTHDGDDLGEIMVYRDHAKKYYYKRDLDGRGKNSILFMRFDKEDENFEKFRKTQLYYYQKLMIQLEIFLNECGIAFTSLDFQANCYLEKPFIDDSNMTSVVSLDSLVIINNTGSDFSDLEKQFLQNFLSHQGITNIQFFCSGKTISTYESVAVENDEDTCWQINEVVPWSTIVPNKQGNYLVFNKLLDYVSIVGLCLPPIVG